MNPELIRELQAGIATAERLRKMLQEDREDMCGCINGELLAAYLNATDAAEQQIKRLRQQLVDLQALQILGL